ncbi:MAG: hypothetical protein JJT78_04670 [Leptospira sp.]|nr:hypothetical protein [Leptospira sp.]
MLKPDLPELKVLEYSQALQRTQNLESRGDLQNKGIYKLLITLYEWSEKFLSNKSLPTLETLDRDLGIEEEKLRYFVLEYAIRNNPPLFRKINYVDFSVAGGGELSNPKSYLKHFTVFCRPTAADGVTCYRYVTGLNDVSIEAIRRWISERRVPPPKDERKDFYFRCIDSNKLYETYASTEIGNLFQCEFDKTKKLRDTTLILHIKPILKRLVDEKLIFFLRNDNASKPGNKSIFYYFNKEEIFDRLDIYMDYLREKIVPDLVRLGVLKEPDEDDFRERKNLVETVRGYMNESYGDQKTIVEEILLLNDFYEKEMDKVEQEKKRQNLDQLMEQIKSSGKIMDLNTLKIDNEPINEDARNFILESKNILYTEYADKNSYYEYILHRLNMTPAIESAIQLYRASENDSEITILRFMGVIDEVDDYGLKETFEEVESRALFSFLPFFTWLWRWITGNKTVHKYEAEAIRGHLRQGIQEKIRKNRVVFLAEQKQKQASSEKIKESKKNLNSKNNSASKISSARNEFLDESGRNSQSKPFEDDEKDEMDPLVLENLKKIVSVLNEAWEFGYYPDRSYLLEKLEGSFSEQDLVQFLKKKGGKDIYSFMIRNHPEKYPFPILVTREYLKKNGSKLLSDVEKILEEQKNQALPDQSKFDKAVSIAEFLDRVLPKIK